MECNTIELCIKISVALCALRAWDKIINSPIAQLAKALTPSSEGRGFESHTEQKDLFFGQNYFMAYGIQLHKLPVVLHATAAIFAMLTLT